MTSAGFERFLIRHTESFLTLLKRRRLRKKSREKRVHPVLDWGVSIIIIILCVILINMFLFQNYRIPSPSMVPELKEGDLIFVEKLSFGPEVLPGMIKLPAVRKPERGEVVSFESNLYARQGPLVELAERFVYFITFSLVNLKTDEANNPLKDLLIKRVIGLPGDRVREFTWGFEIKPALEQNWVPEKWLVMKNGVTYTIPYETDVSIGAGYRRVLATALQKILIRSGVRRGDPGSIEDRETFERHPGDSEAAHEWHKRELGFYVPPDMFFPLGDNRLASRDARYFGPVPLERIQGRALFRFFPFDRLGAIK